MLNPKSKIQNPKSKIPTFLPLPDAARKFNLTEQVLTQLIKAGKIEAVQLPSGELLVPDNNHKPRTKKEIIAKEFAHLRGQSITISQAVKDYKIPDSTIRNWVTLKYINTIDTEKRYPMTVDEADVAYCAKIYYDRGGQSGTRLFDESGDPYQLKHPKLAEYRRKKAKRQDATN
jgi:hypothetical protein